MDPAHLIREMFKMWNGAKQDPTQFRTVTIRYNDVQTKAFSLI